MKSALKIANEFIRAKESCAKKRKDGLIEAYPDPLKGWAVPTIGWGTTRYPWGEKVLKGDIILQVSADRFLALEVRRCLDAVLKIPTAKFMKPNQLAALTSFGYNLGANFYRARNRESISKLCVAPWTWSDKDYVISTFVKYRNPGSNVEAGLRKRRLAEANLFLGIG